MILSLFYKLAEGRSAKLLAVALLLLAAMAARAQSDFRYQGVITQGAVHTTDNHVNGDSDDGVSFEFTELALNFATELPWELEFTGQGMYRHTGEAYEEVDVDYLILSRGFAVSSDSVVGFRLGRFKNPLGLYNETRDIAFTRPAVFVPEAIYTENFRDLLLSTDGLAVYGSLFTDAGEWSVELGAGKPRIKSDSLQSLDAYTAKFSNDRSIVGRLAYEHNGGQWKAALSYLNLQFDMSLSGVSVLPFPPFTVTPFANLPGRLDHARWIASLEYNWNDWTLTGEYTLSDFDIVATGVFPPLDFTNEGYYIAARKRLTPDWSVFYRWEQFFGDKDDPTGSRFTGSPFPTYSGFRKSHVVGTRWDISSNWLLMVDYHLVDGTALLSDRDNPVPADQVKRWRMLAATLSFRF